MRIFYGTAAYRRSRGNLPELRLVNMFVEKTPADEAGVVLIDRPGLSSHSSAGAGPVTGVFAQDGVFSGDLFRVSGGVLYRGTTSIGTIAGGGPVSFAAGASDELAVCAGASIYRYDGSTLAAVSFPDSASVTAITFHDGLYLAARADTHKWYWSTVLDADTWGALDFASAESRPDTLKDLRVLNDTLFLFGTETIEPWANTGNADLPYSRIEQRIFSKGLHSTGCVVEMDNSLLFVANDGMAYRMAEVPERISDHGIEERIGGSAAVSCFGFILEGHSFFCIRLDDGTFAYDVSTGQWCEFACYGESNFRGRCAVTMDRTVYLGDDRDGTVWTLDGHEDASGVLERLFTAAFPLEGPYSVNSIRVEANVGQTALLSGQGATPVMEMRTSRDAGVTWGTWRSANMGSQGNYRTRTEWRRLGMFDDPGFMAEFRVTDPIGLRLSKVSIPEQSGGRSR